ncbi:MAG: hypothetical protein ACLFR2_06765 [Candidatus Kapaibacterium sp.]
MFEHLTTEGIIFLIIAWGSVFALTGFCVYKVMTAKVDLEEDNKIFEENPEV